jgi:hypothetical protein
MAIETGVLDYLNEIRDEVCSRCAARHADDADCLVFGPPCGMELTLIQLIETIDPVQAGRLADEDKQAQLMRCPCPREEMADLVVEASEAVEQGRQRRSRLAEWWNDG